MMEKSEGNMDSEQTDKCPKCGMDRGAFKDTWECGSYIAFDTGEFVQSKACCHIAQLKADYTQRWTANRILRRALEVIETDGPAVGEQREEMIQIAIDKAREELDKEA